MYLAELVHLHVVSQRAGGLHQVPGVVKQAGKAPTECDSYAYIQEQPDR